MGTKILMILSSIILGLLGILFSFLPQEIAAFFSLNKTHLAVIFLQLLSATYLGFAMLNWLSKGNLMGGIYSRPLVAGNFLHFAVGALALVKAINKIDQHVAVFLVITVIYTAFALSFGILFFRTPSSVKSDG